MAISTGRRWLRPPQLRTLDDQGERHATWLELFFDLVFVISVEDAPYWRMLSGRLWVRLRCWRHASHSSGPVGLALVSRPSWSSWAGFLQLSRGC
jgi:hypothetical protein